MSPPPQPERAQALDLNLASEDELERLPGIGPAYATAIAAARDADDSYRSPLDLVEREIIPRTSSTASTTTSRCATPPPAGSSGCAGSLTRGAG